MSRKSKYVLMKRDSSTVGGWTYNSDCSTSREGEAACKRANGMELSLWTREQYEEWHNSSIMPYYRS